MPQGFRSTTSDFVWRHPCWSGVAIAILAVLLAAGVPVVGGTLGTLVLLGGAIAELVVWNVTNASRRALAAPANVAQLPTAPPPPTFELRPLTRPEQTFGTPQQLPAPLPPRPAAVTKRAPVRTTSKARPQRPVLAQIVSQLRVDPTERELDEQVEVAGETYYARQIKAVFRDAEEVIASRGSTLRDLQCLLVPDPWNEHDENAVAVFIGGQQVGHLPAELAEDYAAPLRQIAERGLLVAGQARIWAKDDGGMIRARVTLLVPVLDDL